MSAPAGRSIRTALPNAIHVPIDEVMRTRARADGALRQMSRTRASPWDAYIGTLGELVWAKLRHGEIASFDTLNTRGQVDDRCRPKTQAGQREYDIEVKTSKTRISPHSHLMVREDYARRRQPDFYILVLLPQSQPIHSERDAFVCGWANHVEVVAHPPRERVSQYTGRHQGFRCYEVAAGELHPLAELPFDLLGCRG